MFVCSHCRKEVLKPYWLRNFPNLLFCGKCWKIPQFTEQAVRDSIASAVKRARAKDRYLAKVLLESLRGTGVPTNPRRNRG